MKRLWNVHLSIISICYSIAKDGNALGPRAFLDATVHHPVFHSRHIHCSWLVNVVHLFIIIPPYNL